MFPPVFARSRFASTPPPPRAAFTILELLVAMAITLVLVAALLQIFAATTNTWQRGEAQVDAYREARGALQIMAHDLSSTLQTSYDLPATGTQPLLPTLVLQRYPGTNRDTGPGNEEVYCLTNIPNSGASSLCAVGYYCQWLPDAATGTSQAHAPRAFALMRQFLDSNGTFLRLKTASLAQPAPPAPANPLDFVALYARMSGDTPPIASSTQLAAYIWDLRFRIDTDLNETTYQDGNAADAPMDHSSPPRPYTGTPTGVGYPPNLPAYVEIRFKALSTTAGRRLEGNANVTQNTWTDGDTSPASQTIIRPNAQQFILRVPLLNATPQLTATPSPSP